MSVDKKANVGDRVRSKKYQGVSGIVERIEEHEVFGTIYHTAQGWWSDKQVTVEPQSPPSEPEKP